MKDLNPFPFNDAAVAMLILIGLMASEMFILIAFVMSFAEWTEDTADEYLMPYVELVTEAWNNYRRDSVFLRPQVVVSIPIQEVHLFSLDEVRYARSLMRGPDRYVSIKKMRNKEAVKIGIEKFQSKE